MLLSFTFCRIYNMKLSHTRYRPTKKTKERKKEMQTRLPTDQGPSATSGPLRKPTPEDCLTQSRSYPIAWHVENPWTALSGCPLTPPPGGGVLPCFSHLSSGSYSSCNSGGGSKVRVVRPLPLKIYTTLHYHLCFWVMGF